MKILKLTRAESAAYAAGELRFWRAMRKQPQPNGGRGLAPIKPYQTSIGTWTFVLVATGMGNGTSGIPCPYGTTGDRITLTAEGVLWDNQHRITAIAVDQRGGKWGWLLEVGV